MQTATEYMARKESEARNKLEQLYMRNSIVRKALDCHRYDRVSYEEALEIAVIALAEANDALTESLKSVYMKSPTPISGRLGS